MGILKRADLQKLAPRPPGGSKAEIWDGYVGALIDGDDLLYEHGIDTQLELVHLLAQMAHETGGFTILWESGAYSAGRIQQIFGVGQHSARVTPFEAAAIANLRGEARAEALFERVYGLGNPRKARELGNRAPGDGYRFRGFGILQTTGRRDHERLIAGDYTPRGALKAALKEWTAKGCSRWALEDNISRVTKLINGGQNGLVDRRRYLERAKTIWTNDPVYSRSYASHEASEDVDASAPGPAAQEPLPLPEVKEQVRQGSRKWRLLEWLKRLFGFSGVSVLGIMSADQITGASATVGALKEALAEHGLLAMGAMLIIATVVPALVQRYIVEDAREGRYTPSGGAE